MNLIVNQSKNLIAHSLGNQYMQMVASASVYCDPNRKDYIQQICTVSLGLNRQSGHTTAAFEIQNEFKDMSCMTVFPSKKAHEYALQNYENTFGKSARGLFESTNLMDISLYPCSEPLDLIIFDCAGMNNGKKIIDEIMKNDLILKKPGVLLLLQPKVF